MRPTLAIVFLLSFQTVGFAQLIRSSDERRLPGEFVRTSEVPDALTGAATLTFIELGVIFDGGSYGAIFRRDNGRELVIFFLHPGYWSKQATKHKAQPIVVQVDRSRENDVKFEIEPDSPFEKRLVELLNDDIGNKEHSHEQIMTLTRLRGCVRDRSPLPELRKRFPEAFKHESCTPECRTY